MLSEAEQVWWIVPAGDRIRHAITDRPGSRPAGDVVAALCTASVKLPYETWPASREPATRHITTRCAECEERLTERQRGNAALVVNTWDS